MRSHVTLAPKCLKPRLISFYGKSLSMRLEVSFPDQSIWSGNEVFHLWEISLIHRVLIAS